MIGLKTLAKKKIVKPPMKKTNCRKSRVVFVGCVSIFYNNQVYIFIDYANRVLADHGRTQSLT